MAYLTSPQVVASQVMAQVKFETSIFKVQQKFGHFEERKDFWGKRSCHVLQKKKHMFLPKIEDITETAQEPGL